MKKIVSFIIPTLNAQSVLEPCLKSIKNQDFKNYQIIIADGGSTDNTLTIAKKYHAKIIKNPLKTGEAGKAVAVKQAQTQFVALIDSDNILSNKNWLKTMLTPFSDPTIIGSEPWAFTYRSPAGFIERYSALIGANDPYAFIIGVSDRLNHLNNHWTDLNLKQVDHGQYIKITLKPSQTIPTIGANGAIFRTNFLKKNLKSDYLFDIDLIQQALNQTQKPVYFSKVKTSIIHTFCESSIKKFIRKQKRRLVDYYQYKNIRQYNWQSNQFKNNLKFITHTLFISPFLPIFGYLKKPDLAWFFHPIACLLTFFIYSFITLKYKLNLLKPLSRQQWQQ